MLNLPVFLSDGNTQLECESEERRLQYDVKTLPDIARVAFEELFLSKM